MSLSVLFILSQRGDTIIIRDFQREVKKGINEVFFQKVHFYDRDDIAPPIFNVEGINFIYIKRHELYFAIASYDNVSPNYFLEILERLMKIINDHCGEISEEAIRKNFILIYEIIDEMIDFGLPQLCSTEQVKPFVYTEAIPMVKTPNIIQDLFQKKEKSKESIKKPVSNTTNKKSKNEIYIDVIEKLTVLFNAAGKLINSSIDGCIKMKSYLQGNPDLMVILNDDISIGNQTGYSSTSTIDDYNFDSNVISKDFENRKTLYLNPPDGEFTLMNYRINSEFTPPFRFCTIVEESNYKLVLRIRLSANYSDKYFAGNVLIKYNMPKKTSNVHFEYDKKKKGQKVDYIKKDCVCLWKIDKVQGGNEYVIDTKITLETNTPKESRIELGPITCSFEMPNYNISKLQIKELRINSMDKNYQSYKWVRVSTQANSYVIRIA